jgi:glycosyltransferase involved in cell wall biosynthesis
MILISVIVPTKNRAVELMCFIDSLISQSLLPQELVIVDQSFNNTSEVNIKRKLTQFPNIKLIYIYDISIKGLVAAKKVGVSMCSGNIIFFLEDDVILKNDYLYQISEGFNRVPKMVGCSGVIINPPKISITYKFFFLVFHRGIFFDPRILIFGNENLVKHNLLRSDKISGGVSAWKREVFEQVDFDIFNDFHMYEDIDFSTRVARHYGNRLFINPNARLAHYCSPINRDVLDIRQRRKVRELFTYYKKRKDWPSATISFYWLLLGMFLESIFQSFSSMSFKPIQGYLLGLQDGSAKKIIS